MTYDHKPRKTEQEIIREWDNLAEKRLKQIQSGKDLSYNYIIKPCIFDLIRKKTYANVLDVGCGVGVLTCEFSRLSDRIFGVDCSGKSIDIARREFSMEPVEFVHDDIRNYVAGKKKNDVELVVANMVLMDVIDLTSCLNAIFTILAWGGDFVFTITHPWFWPDYCGYQHEGWFNYHDEIVVEGEFQISLEEHAGGVSTHVHRSLERYVLALGEVGLGVDKIVEPMPSPEIGAKFPNKWKYPRYLGVRCTKMRN